MNKFYKVLLFFTLLTGSATSMAAVHWSATIDSMTVRDNGIVSIKLQNPETPNPGSATWNCQHSRAFLYSQTEVAPDSLVSFVMALYLTKTPVRIGIGGSGENCVVFYITGL